MILLAETEEEKARTLASRLLEAIRNHQWPVAPVTISIGLSALDPAIADTHHLLTRADEALYDAKCSGRDRAVAYADVHSQIPSGRTHQPTSSPLARRRHRLNFGPAEARTLTQNHELGSKSE